MKRTKWIVGVRNRLTDFIIECDSCAAIEDTKMTEYERKQLQKLFAKAREWIDKKVFVR